MSYSPLEILLDTTYLLPILGVDVPWRQGSILHLSYMTARDNGIRFLTRDEELIEFIRSIGEDTSVFLSEELKSMK